MQLTQDNKCALLWALFHLPFIDRNEKFAILDKVLADDKSELAITTRLYCKAAIPDIEDKKEVWKEIIENPAGLTIDQRDTMIRGFVSPGQESITNSFLNEQFFSQAVVIAKNDWELVDIYFERLMPIMQPITEELIGKMEGLKGKVD